MLNSYTEEIEQNVITLEIPERKIFKIDRRIRMIENGGFDLISLIRLFASYIAIIFDIIVFFTKGMVANSNLIFISVIAISNIILFSSADILLESKYIIRSLKVKDTMFDLDNASAFILHGTVKTNTNDSISILLNTEIVEIRTQFLRVKEKMKKYKIGTPIVLCCVKDGNEFEIMDCLKYDSYILKAKSLYQKEKIKESKTYKTMTGLLILMIVAFILSLIIRIFMI